MKIAYLVGRDAKTGKFLPLAVARRRKATATVEMVRYERKRVTEPYYEPLSGS